MDENRLKARRLIDRGTLTLGKAEQEALKLMQKSIRDASIISNAECDQLFVRFFKNLSRPWQYILKICCANKAAKIIHALLGYYVQSSCSVRSF